MGKYCCRQKGSPQHTAAASSFQAMVTPAEVAGIASVLQDKPTCGFEALCCTDAALDLLPSAIGDQIWAGRDLEGLCCC
jgi:hypothetical protein